MKSKIILILLLFLIAVSSVGFSASKELLEWEDKKLDFEAKFLIAKFDFPAEKFDLFSGKDSIFSKTLIEKYQLELISVKALHHCIMMEKSVSDVISFIEKSHKITDEKLRSTMPCIRDFQKDPIKHWPDAYKYTLFIFSQFDQDALYKNIKGSETDADYTFTNPTLNFIYLWGKNYPNQDKFYIDRAVFLERNGYLDRATDVYTRAMNIITNDGKEDFRTREGFYLMNIDRNERESIKTLYSCSKSMQVENPFSDIFKKTVDKSKIKVTLKQGTFPKYDIKPTEIPCVDQKSTDRQKVETFEKLSIGVRSDTFIKIVRESDRDIKAEVKKLDRYITLLQEVEALENRFKEGFSSYEEYYKNSYDNGKKTPYTNLRKLILLNAKIRKLSKAVDTPIRGVSRCTSGMLIGMVSEQGAAFVVVGVLALPLEGAAATTAGGVFIATGAYSTAEQSISIAEEWNNLDTSEKYKGICDLVITDVLSYAGAKVAHFSLPKGKKISKKDVQIKSKEEAAPISEQVNDMKERNTKQPSETPPKEKVSTTPELDKLVETISPEKAPFVKRAGKLLKYDEMPPQKKAIFDKLVQAFVDGSGDGVFAARVSEMEKIQDRLADAKQRYKSADLDQRPTIKEEIESIKKEYDLVDDFGADVLLLLIRHEYGKKINLLGKANRQIVKSIVRGKYKNVENYNAMIRDIIDSVGDRKFTDEQIEAFTDIAQRSYKDKFDKAEIDGFVSFDKLKKLNQVTDFIDEQAAKAGMTNPKIIYNAGEDTLLSATHYNQYKKNGKYAGNIYNEILDIDASAAKSFSDRVKAAGATTETQILDVVSNMYKEDPVFAKAIDDAYNQLTSKNIIYGRDPVQIILYKMGDPVKEFFLNYAIKANNPHSKVLVVGYGRGFSENNFARNQYLDVPEAFKTPLTDSYTWNDHLRGFESDPGLSTFKTENPSSLIYSLFKIFGQ